MGSGDMAADIKLTSIISQLTLLTIHFPQLRILWSKWVGLVGNVGVADVALGLFIKDAVDFGSCGRCNSLVFVRVVYMP